MDMKKMTKIPKCGNDDGKIIVGTKQLKKALAKGCAKVVFLAENADPAVTEPLAELCLQQNIHITWVSSMSELGQRCGIEVGAAAAAVIDP